MSKYAYLILFTVKPVLRGHLLDKEKVALYDIWSLKRSSIRKKFSMTEQENMTLIYIHV